MFNSGKNYKLSNGDVFTGQQMNNLVKLAASRNPMIKTALLLDAEQTDEPATRPDSKYGAAEGDEIDPVQQTHWDGCWKEHHSCAVALIERIQTLTKYGNLYNVDRVYEVMDDIRQLTAVEDSQ